MKKSLPFRLYGGLTVSVVLVLAVGLITVNALEKQNEQSKWIGHTVEVTNQLRDIRFSLLQMRGARRAFWITSEARQLDNYLQGTVLVPTLVQNLEKLVSDNTAQEKRVKKLGMVLMELFRFWAMEGGVVVNETRDQFRIKVLTEEKMLTEAFLLFDSIKSEEGKLLVSRQAVFLEYSSQTRTLVIGGIILLLGVVLILINTVIQTFKSRYRSSLKLKETIGEMERLNISAAEKNWLLEGVTFIASKIQSASGTNNLSKDIIEAIVGYMALPAGVIYMADEEQKLLRMTASVAASSSAPTSFDIGDGIVGNASIKKYISIIKDIPGGYWKIESGLGGLTGKGQIAFLPLWMKDDLKAVIELGNMGEFTALQLKLLETISNNLVVSITARQSRLKINKLLEQVQEQKESLTAQQEELRQSNEELSLQSEELRASEEELKTQEEELRQINLELNNRNKAIDKASKVLTEKAAELEIASKYKSEFLANMSHELRTPLNSILILGRLLADNNTNNLTPKQIEYANIIHKSGTGLLELINDILDLSKIEAGKVELTIEEVTINSIAADIRQLFSVVATEKNIHFNIDLAALPVNSVKTDKQRIGQVLKNLLSNAFKFTPREGSITLSFSGRRKMDQDMIAISVSDTGIGISEDQQKLIFGAFQQADGSTSRKYGGTGLGLSISKELMRLLGGEIELQSEKGAGSTFTVLLPSLGLPNKTTKGSGAAEIINGTDTVVEVPDNLVKSQVLVEDDRNNILTGDKVMLIIEDDVSFATILKDYARNKGYKPIVALQGDEGLQYARKYKPDIMILDIQLPVIDGWSLLKICREDNELKKIPIHIISAVDDKTLQQSGALAYLKKPIDLHALDAVFDTVGGYLTASTKRVLVMSPSHFTCDRIGPMFREKHPKVVFDHVVTVSEAFFRLESGKYGCILVDIGADIESGLKQVQQIHESLNENKVPIIIYLDVDISPAEELLLKKVSNAIVRNSSFAHQRLLDEMELFLYKVQHHVANKEHVEAAQASKELKLAGRKVLLVDDDMRNVFSLSTALESQQLVVVTASDGFEALEQLRVQTDIELVLMDIMMPGMDGYEAMQHIRNDMHLKTLPVIALTAKAMAGDREKCISAGASDYITKPVDIHKLFSLMHVWLSR